VLVRDPSHPGPVRRGALLEDRRLNAFDTDDVVEEMDQVLGTLQTFDIAGHDDAIPARVHELDSGTQ
jgi:hypothetical protein